MNRIESSFSIALLMVSMSAGLAAQNPTPQQNDAERLRIELAERARQETEQRDWETKIFPIKYVDPNELRVVLSMFRANIGNSGGSLRVLSVRAPKEIMPAIEDAIKRLDVPSLIKSAELTVYVLMASDRPDAATSSNIPTTLQPVVNQLKSVLSYKGFQLLDTLFARASDQRNVNLTGFLAIAGSTSPTNYELKGQFRIDDRNEKAPILQIRNMQFLLRAPVDSQNYQSLTINTDVDIPRGQQVVVGKTTFGDKAFILVMTAKFD